MSVLSWNCQGAGSTETIQRLREMRRVHFLDFIFLMETKQKDKFMIDTQRELGYDNLINVEPVGLSGGLAVMWKNCYSVAVLQQDKRIIDLQVGMGSMTFYLTCVYGDPVRERRQAVWERLCDIGLIRDDPWMLVGDFNELLSNDEKLGGAVRHDSTFWDFRNLVENCKTRDMRSSGNPLSWAGKRENDWVQCRLDRCFGNDAWYQLFPRSHVEYMAMYGSDHRPLRIGFALEGEGNSRGRFYFDNRMVGKKGVEDAVRKGWCKEMSGRHFSILERIESCRKELARWKKRTTSNAKINIQRLQVELETEIGKTRPNTELMKHLKLELGKAYREEEVFWRQKCREHWLREGDRNTAYFHNCVRGRKAKNRILMLRDLHGTEHFSEGAKGHIATEFYRDLFMSSNPHDLQSLFNGFTERVSPEMNALLCKEITADEIRRAAFAIRGNSAPGEDGLTGTFYQKYWHIVGAELVAAVQGFFKDSIIPPGWNHTQLSLLPKIVNPSQMSDMRPISLCSVQYKIISKILCDRLKSILPDIISDTQGAFVQGRLISDNIVIAHELVHGLRTNYSVSKEFMAIKTDMSKAYDRVEWCFLEELLERMGFDRIWVRWVMACITTVTYSVLLNGRSHGLIKPERGIRQGDPLSPFLFILCAEALVSKLNQSEGSGRLTGIGLSSSGPRVHHLLFADDSLLMCKANEVESTEVLECLKAYGDASGQRINLQKTSIIFGSQVLETTKAQVKDILGIGQEGGEGNYLGLPECFKGSKRDLLSFIREKLQSRLHGWFAKTLSLGGKEVLLKSIAMSLPVYAMSIFKLPKDVCTKITSAMIEFWWGGGNGKRKIPWVAWKKLCKQKKEGGLGFHDITKFNQSLLGKQAWRIMTNPNSLVARVLKSKYFENSDFQHSTLGSRPSYAWRSILHGRELLSKGLVRDIGNGENSNVWGVNWIIDPAPRPPNYRQDSIIDLTLKISDLLIPNTSSWDSGRVRQAFTEHDAEIILRLKPNCSKEDGYKWGFTKDGCYSSRSGYKFLDSLPDENDLHQPPLPPLEKHLWSSLWKIKAPAKLKHFLWKALSGALAVMDRLRSRGIQVDPMCKVCNNGTDTICHLLFTCPMARDVWERASIVLPSGGFSQNSVFLNLYHLLKQMQKKPKDMDVQAFPWIIWYLWKSRNGLIFERRHYSSVSVLLKAREEANVWFELNVPGNEGNQTSLTTLQTSPSWT